MTTPEPMPPDPDTPQVLLFGHTGAGKSALLAALVRAGETQGETLHGEVQESSGRLAALRDAVYRGTELAQSNTELTSYTIRLRPWRDGTQSVANPTTVVLHDCSGKAAEGLIRHPSSLRDSETRAPVARAVIDADAIVLLVDATSDDEELQEAFEEFDTFLTVVAQGKANAREVGGYPILLVLTKCDELAVPGDTRAQWEGRVQHRAERAWKQFDAFLKDADPDDSIPSPFLPFGSIDLSVHAVAIRQPKLADSPAAPDTPYRVAELFRDCFDAARTHRERVTASNRQLKWTVRAALVLVGALFLGSLGVALFPPQRGDPGLAERVKGYVEHEPEAAVRLADGTISKNKQELAAFRDDPAFIGLPGDLRSFVVGRLKEIDDYRAYRAKLAFAISPGDTRTLDDLKKVERALVEGELRLPEEYTWGKTAAAQLRDKWRADVSAIREAEAKFLERYRDFVRRGTVLTLSPGFGGNWRADVETLTAEAARPPAPFADPLSGSPTLNQPRGQAVANRVPYEFERVYHARRDWDYTRDRLARLRELADALDLTAGPDRPDAVLALPEPGPGLDSAKLPGMRLFALRHLTREPDDLRVLDLSNFPDPGRAILADRLDRSFRTGARHVHALILARIGSNAETKDTPDGWRAVADGLIDPAFADWGRLLHLLLRLRDPAATNPVTELAAFLRTTKFDLDLKGFDLLIPPDLSLDKVVPSGPLTVAVTPRTGGSAVQRFKQSGTAVREGSAMSYRFLGEGNRKLTYQPGDELRVEIPVRSGTQELKLVWEVGGTKTYQFDRFNREPRLVKANGNSEPATGVRLTPTEGSSVPRLPALFPELKK